MVTAIFLYCLISYGIVIWSYMDEKDKPGFGKHWFDYLMIIFSPITLIFLIILMLRD